MTYNQRIKWLMLNERTERHKVCCDKFLARGEVPERARVPLLYASEQVEDCREYPYILKCSHDSGSSRVIRSDSDLDRAKAEFPALLSRTYGVNKGEWAYAYAKPRVMAEMLLADNTDYKFHVCQGTTRWVQVIWGRSEGPYEAIFLPDGTLTDLHMDEQMIHAVDPSKYPGHEAWQEMRDLAERLAQGFQYARIDLYWSGKPYFGEFTFWPRAGNYRHDSGQIFGEMLCWPAD